MTVKRIIETYEEFIAALQAKKSDDRVERNEAKNALGNLRIKYPEQFEKYSKWYEGIEEPLPTIQVKPRKPRALPADKERYIQEHPEINVEELRNKARERLMKGKYGMGIRFDLPSWISERDLLSSVETLAISDLITADGSLAQRAILYRKCIRRAAASGRVDEMALRQTILNSCRNLWNMIKTHPNYSFEALQYYILKVATNEELANAGVNPTDIIDVMFNNKISKLNIEELREREIKEKVEKLKRENPSEIRRLAKKAWNYIQKHCNGSDDFPLPENCKIEDLKLAIDKISDDDLWTAFDGKRIEANKLYELCVKTLTNKDAIKPIEIDMNAQGRKEIAKYIAALEEIKNKLESMKDDEEEKFDNMPEGLQESERGEAMQEAIEQLETACDSLDEVISALQEI